MQIKIDRKINSLDLSIIVTIQKHFMKKNTLLICVGRGNFDNKRRCSRSKNFGIFSNGMFPHFLISQRFKYVANEHINARLKVRQKKKIHSKFHS